MSSRSYIALFALLGSALLPGCEDDPVVVGASGQIDSDLAQSALGAFSADSSTAIDDVNGDGRNDLIVWTNALQQFPQTEEEFVTPQKRIFIFFGREGGFGSHLDREDADVSFIIPMQNFVARVVAQDLDDDGRAELLVHINSESSDYFWSVPEEPNVLHGALYVVAGDAIISGVHELANIGELIPAYEIGTEYVVHSRYVHRDLDGVAGQEFLTESYRLADVGVTTINVRDIATGETRARLLAPELEYLDVRGVLDHDGDGVPDVAVSYVRGDEANPNNRRFWTETGIGIFYGPITGDVTLGDEGTQRIPVLFPLLRVETSVMVGGAARTTVGDLCGDQTDDVVVFAHASDGRGVTICIAGGSRTTLPFPNDQQVARTTFRLDEPEWAFGVRPAGADRMRLFAMLREGFAVFAPAFAPREASDDVLVNRVNLDYDTPGTPSFTSLGGTMGDLDGDGSLDLALGTHASEPGGESFVHVIYGFGG